eukprot:gnl/MRDRNA2_/MRDRNA2_149139_c0_seq1.p1 gnl/MRDRNA2_/MRDRNA2_149139_c0~~gnl/MRDRNA2_/MRDRNA2_149139_c0_seq1.p1  ORF type:complete len:438 (+),score=84.18 gnl/MRDRNA2_/MRDRNA2_149139_c0_seq1:152-1315(+)
MTAELCKFIQGKTKPPPNQTLAGTENVGSPRSQIAKHLSVHKVGVDCHIANTVVFEGPACIGDRCTLQEAVIVGAGCYFEEDVRVRGNVRFGEHCVVRERTSVKGKVQFGKKCEVGESTQVTGEVTLGDGCILHEQVLMLGPVVAGHRNYFGARSFIGLVDGGACGHIEIGDDCFFNARSAILQPRGKLFPTWRAHEMVVDDSGAPVPSVTRIGNRVRVDTLICHDCILEDDVGVGGNISGYCHLMQNCRLAPGCNLHQFTTVGTRAFIAMGTNLRADVLPYTVVDDILRCLVDHVALARAGVDGKCSQELQDFYGQFCSHGSVVYLRYLTPEMETACKGKWFEEVLTNFLDARNNMRDMRPLMPFSARAEDPDESNDNRENPQNET